MNSLQQLLWDLRKDKAVAERFRQDPDETLDSYGIEGEERAAMRAFDIKELYELGVNPYLLYFCALEIGVDRADYYARIRGEAV
ncbi:MAG: aromatic ring-opening dioxygenase subunit LigA [Acidimicrobiales bacterium]